MSLFGLACRQSAQRTRAFLSGFAAFVFLFSISLRLIDINTLHVVLAVALAASVLPDAQHGAPHYTRAERPPVLAVGAAHHFVRRLSHTR